MVSDTRMLAEIDVDFTGEFQWGKWATRCSVPRMDHGALETCIVWY